MPEDSKYDRNIQTLLTGQIKFVVVDGNSHVSFNVMYQTWMNSIKKNYTCQL